MYFILVYDSYCRINYFHNCFLKWIHSSYGKFYNAKFSPFCRKWNTWNHQDRPKNIGFNIAKWDPFILISRTHKQCCLRMSVRSLVKIQMFEMFIRCLYTVNFEHIFEHTKILNITIVNWHLLAERLDTSYEQQFFRLYGHCILNGKFECGLLSIWPTLLYTYKVCVRGTDMTDRPGFISNWFWFTD